MDFKLKYEGPWAELDELLSLPTGTWRSERPITNTSKCCQCGWCYIFCPTGSIIDRGRFFSADLDYCKGCGICARVCSKNAVIMVQER